MKRKRPKPVPNLHRIIRWWYAEAKSANHGNPDPEAGREIEWIKREALTEIKRLRSGQ